MKRILLTVLIVGFINCQPVFSQGCVAIKNMTCTALPGFQHTKDSTARASKWELNLGYRYFRSYKHFVGSEEQKQRVEQGTEVVNRVHSIDIGLIYNINSRLAASLSIPVIFNYRSSLYEHYGNSTTANPNRSRFATNSNGIGDIRLAASYWIINPKKHSKGNIAMGLGIKLPTGNAEVLDDFHRRKANGTDSTFRKAVDQSIQLGDGGFGFSIEAQGYQKLFKNASLYYNGFYLFNPRNTNDNYRGGSAPLIAYNSVPDQFSFRLGMNYMMLKKKNLSVNLGGRVEGLPARDAIGKSEGFRRPGYIISVEPGVSLKTRRIAYQLNVPFAVYRNRTKSVYDRADPAGLRHGDAAFADYLINLGLSFNLGK